MDEITYFLACLFIQISTLITQPVHSAVHIGIVVLVNVNQRLNHLPWTLCGGRIIQIDERRIPTNLSRQDWKIRSIALGVKSSSGIRHGISFELL